MAFTTGHDFSFLGGLLKIGGFVALGVIVASILFGFSLGLFFVGLMILFAGGAVLYNTSTSCTTITRISTCGVAGAVRLGGAAVLVRAAGGHGLHVR